MKYDSSCECLVDLMDPTTSDIRWRLPQQFRVDKVFRLSRSVSNPTRKFARSAPTLSRGFNLAREVLKPRVTFHVHGGIETWPIAGGVTAIALVDLMRKLVKT
jgi:hypothetical protein